MTGFSAYAEHISSDFTDSVSAMIMWDKCRIVCWNRSVHGIECDLEYLKGVNLGKKYFSLDAVSQQKKRQIPQYKQVFILRLNFVSLFIYHQFNTAIA